MSKHIICIMAGLMVLYSSLSMAQSKGDDEIVEMSGISIIGNRELPKTLFIVPWKNSEVGLETELTNTLHEGMEPLDREVFNRELEYYEFSHGAE